MPPIHLCLVPLLLFVQGSSGRVTTNKANVNSTDTVDLVQDLQRGTNVDLIPCPFIAAFFKRGFIKSGWDGKWSRADASKAIDIVAGPLNIGGWSLLALKEVILSVFFGFSLGIADTTKMRIPLNEWSGYTLHKYHTGIRLAKVSGDTADPWNWRNPCRPGGALDSGPPLKRALLGPSGLASNCGGPGVHPEVFDKLVDEAGISNEKWTAKDVQLLCEMSKKMFYGGRLSAIGASYKEGGQPADVCGKLYGMAAKFFEPLGGLSKNQWKDFLVYANFPSDPDDLLGLPPTKLKMALLGPHGVA